MVLKHHCCVPAQSERTSASCGVTFCPSYTQKTALGRSFLFAAGGANQVHLSERSAWIRHGFHHHIVCGLLHRLPFGLRSAGSNFANSKTESAPATAVPQLHGKPSFEPAPSSGSIYHWGDHSQFSASRTSLHARCRGIMWPDRCGDKHR
jgi:hypothetical protein